MIFTPYLLRLLIPILHLQNLHHGCQSVETSHLADKLEMFYLYSNYPGSACSLCFPWNPSEDFRMVLGNPEVHGKLWQNPQNAYFLTQSLGNSPVSAVYPWQAFPIYKECFTCSIWIENGNLRLIMFSLLCDGCIFEQYVVNLQLQ